MRSVFREQRRLAAAFLLHEFLDRGFVGAVVPQREVALHVVAK